MILDDRLILDRGRNLSGSPNPGAGDQGFAATLGTDNIDLTHNRDLVEGKEGLWIEFRVTTAFVAHAAGAPGLQVAIAAASDTIGTNLTTLLISGGNPYGSPWMTVNALTLNSVIHLPLPRMSRAMTGLSTFTNGLPTYYQRYLVAVYYNPAWVTANNFWDAGVMSARIVQDPIGPWKQYNDGIP